MTEQIVTRNNKPFVFGKDYYIFAPEYGGTDVYKIKFTEQEWRFVKTTDIFNRPVVLLELKRTSLHGGIPHCLNYRMNALFSTKASVKQAVREHFKSIVSSIFAKLELNS